MNIEIAVSRIDETVETYTLYGDFTITEENGDDVVEGEFTWSQESGMPAEVIIRQTVAIEELDELLDDDMDVNDMVSQAVSEMFNTGNLIEHGYVFETTI